MDKITSFGWYWLIWAFLGFGIPEAYGLIKNAKDTLSWQVWGLEKINLGHPFDFAIWTPLHWIIGIFFLLGLTWLFLHLSFGLLR